MEWKILVTEKIKLIELTEGQPEAKELNFAILCPETKEKELIAFILGNTGFGIKKKVDKTYIQ